MQGRAVYNSLNTAICFPLALVSLAAFLFECLCVSPLIFLPLSVLPLFAVSFSAVITMPPKLPLLIRAKARVHSVLKIREPPPSKAETQRRREVLRDQLRVITEPHSNCRLLQAPLEILLAIADYLPDEAKAALALTCKTLWWKWKCVFAKPEIRTALLPLLEREVPGVVFCYQCEKLERIRPGLRPGHKSSMFNLRPGEHVGAHLPPLGLPATPWQRYITSDLQFGLEDVRLNFYHVHLVMNGHRYGRRHGLPLETLMLDRRKLDSKATFPYITPDAAPDAARVTRMTWTPRIIDDELFLCETIRMYGAERKELTQNVVRHSWHECAPYHFWWPPGKREWRSRRSDFLRITLSCQRCLATEEVVLRTTAESQKWDMIVKRYRQLGRCESPRDWKWARYALANSCDNPDTVGPFSPWDDRGEIMKRWREASASFPKGVYEPFRISRDYVRDIEAMFPDERPRRTIGGLSAGHML